MKNTAEIKSLQSDFVNRVAPFDGNALIQKSELLTVEQEIADNTIFKKSTKSVISDPAASIVLDFANFEEVSINSLTAGSSFTITVNNLAENVTGRISIEKKSGDVFTFANAEILNFEDSTEGQVGKTAISFSIVNVGADIYKAIPTFQHKITTGMIGADAVTTEKLNNFAVTVTKIASGAVQFGKIGTNAVESNNIQSGAVTGVKVGVDVPTAIKSAGLDIDTLISVNRSIPTATLTGTFPAGFSATWGFLFTTTEGRQFIMGLEGIYTRVYDSGGAAWAGWIKMAGL